jgi:HTH-type transcriptional regulator/antitoxin HigA
MEAKILKTEDDYEKALEIVAGLMDARPNTKRAERLELWSFLLEDYERREHPIAFPDPVDAILFRMDQEDLKPRDLEPFIGSRSKVSEVLNRKRPLSIAMMRRLHEGLGIPAESLLKPTTLTTA